MARRIWRCSVAADPSFVASVARFVETLKCGILLTEQSRGRAKLNQPALVQNGYLIKV